MKKMDLRSMASGHMYLEVSQTVGWDDFPMFADELVAMLDATVLDKAEAVDIRIWKIGLPACTLRLVYEDYPLAVSLESMSDEGDRFLRELREQLESR
jgi:hypothetical protein